MAIDAADLRVFPDSLETSVKQLDASEPTVILLHSASSAGQTKHPYYEVAFHGGLVVRVLCYY
jgi:hypothetical protein